MVAALCKSSTGFARTRIPPTTAPAFKDLQFQSSAVGLLHTIAEELVVALFLECTIYVAHAKRKTVLAADLNLATTRDAEYQLNCAQAQAEVMCDEPVRKQKQRL